MKTIWKFELDVISRQDFNMPAGARIIHVGTQPVDSRRESVFLWAEVDTDNADNRRFFECLGTGFEMPNNMGLGRVHIGTVFTNQGRFVWHFYERITNETP